MYLLNKNFVYIIVIYWERDDFYSIIFYMDVYPHAKIDTTLSLPKNEKKFLDARLMMGNQKLQKF